MKVTATPILSIEDPLYLILNINKMCTQKNSTNEHKKKRK